MKTIEHQGKRQANRIPNQGEVKTTKKYSYSDNYSSMILKQNEKFNKLMNIRFDEITELEEKINTDELIYK